MIPGLGIKSAEWFIHEQKIWWYYNLHQMDKVMVYMLILGFIGLLIDYIFRYGMNRTLLKWRQGEVN